MLIAHKLQGAGGLFGDAPLVPQNGLVFHIDAGDLSSYPGSGNVWYDISGVASPMDATYTTTPAPYSSANDGVMDLPNTSTRYFDLPTVTSSDPLKLYGETAFSVAFAYKADSYPNDFPRVIDVSNSGGANNGWGISHNTRLGNRYLNFTVNGIDASTTNNSVTSGNWYLAVFVYDNASWTWRLNGSVNNSGTQTMTPPADTINVARIGQWYYPSITRHVDGKIGFIAVWSRALSSAEATEVYDNYKDRYGV